MSDQKFILSFAITIALVTLALYTCSISEEISPYIDIGIYSASIFSVLSIVVYIMTKMMSKVKKKVLFIQVIMLNMLTKMTISAVIVYLYYVMKSPDDGLFIIPFLVVYVLFTIFETYFMNEQAKAK